MERLLRSWREVLHDGSIDDEKRAEKIDSVWREFDCGLEEPSSEAHVCDDGRKAHKSG